MQIWAITVILCYRLLFKMTYCIIGWLLSPKVTCISWKCQLDMAMFRWCYLYEYWLIPSQIWKCYWAWYTEWDSCLGLHWHDRECRSECLKGMACNSLELTAVSRIFLLFDPDLNVHEWILKTAQKYGIIMQSESSCINLHILYFNILFNDAYNHQIPWVISNLQLIHITHCCVLTQK